MRDTKSSQTASESAADGGGPGQGSPPTGGVTRRELIGAGAGVVVGAAAGVGLGLGPLASTKTSTTGGASTAPVVVGSSIPLTGFASGDGQDMQRGFKIAVDEVNARGGIGGRPLKWVFLDAGPFAPDVMVNNFKRLITEFKVDAVLGGYQTNTGPEYDIVANAGVIYIHNNTIEQNAATVRNNPQKYWMIFQHDPSEAWYSRSLPKFLSTLESSGAWKPHNHNVAIINANNSYSAGLTTEFQKSIQGTPWQVSMVEQVTAPNTEWGATLAKLRANPPGVIWVTDYFAGDDASFMQQFVPQPTPSLVHFQYGPSVPEFLNLAKTAGNFVTWASVIAITQDVVGKAFQDTYRARFNQEPGLSQGGSTYDSTLLYATAAAIAGGPDDRRKVASALRKIIFRGVTGSRRFDPNDQTNRPYPSFTPDPSLGMPTQYFQIQNGQQVVIDPVPYTTGKFQAPPWLS